MTSAARSTHHGRRHRRRERRLSRLFASVKAAAGATVKAIPSVLTAGTAFFATPIPGWINVRLLEKPLPTASNLVVFVSDIDYMANSYRGLLQDEGLAVKVLDPGYIDNVLTDKPRVVIFGPDQELGRMVSLSKHPKVLEYLRQKAKVVGMGTSGGLIFDQIGESPLSLGQMKGLTSEQVRLRDGFTLPGFTLGESGYVQVYTGGNKGESEQQAVPALGSHVLPLKSGIAQPPGEADACGSYWSIVQYENLLFWGFASAAYNLTPAGRQLFVGLVKEMADLSDWEVLAPFKVLPGQHRYQTLDCNSLQDRHHFDLQPWETVTVTVTPTSGRGLVVTLTDPLGTELTSGRSRPPYRLTRPGVTNGADWRLSVATDASAADSRATYDYNIVESFNWPPLLLSVAIVLVTFVAVLGAVLLAVRWWRTHRGPQQRAAREPAVAKPEPAPDTLPPATPEP